MQKDTVDHVWYELDGRFLLRVRESVSVMLGDKKGLRQEYIWVWAQSRAESAQRSSVDGTPSWGKQARLGSPLDPISTSCQSIKVSLHRATARLCSVWTAILSIWRAALRHCWHRINFFFFNFSFVLLWFGEVPLNSTWKTFVLQTSAKFWNARVALCTLHSATLTLRNFTPMMGKFSPGFFTRFGRPMAENSDSVLSNWVRADG